jgi:hypothetical protein
LSLRAFSVESNLGLGCVQSSSVRSLGIDLCQLRKCSKEDISEVERPQELTEPAACSLSALAEETTEREEFE